VRCWSRCSSGWSTAPRRPTAASRDRPEPRRHAGPDRAGLAAACPVRARIAAAGLAFSGEDPPPQPAARKSSASGFAVDSLQEGDGFEPSVPGDAPWVPSWKMSIILQSLPEGYPRVRRCGDVMFRALVKGSMAWLPLSPCGPSPPGVELPLDAFFLSARDRWFESGSLHR
jgi:hypothetical protein